VRPLRWRWPLVALALAASGGLAWHRLAPRHAPAGQAPLVTLRTPDLAPLRAAFNDASDRYRVLALLSPT
jgi:hypothetical protein